MIEEISKNIPKIVENQCSQIVDEIHFYLKDTEERVILVTAHDKPYIHVENKSNTSVSLIQNDTCMMDNEGKQCDALIVGNDQICYIEIKGTNDNRAFHRRKAYKQLENTIKYYQNKMVFPKEYIQKAFVCFYTKKRIIQTSASTKVKKFKLDFDVILKEGNYIEF